GPVLGVMRAEDLDEAIDLVHATGYGLTSGLHSLDDREQERWASRVRAGNLYVNRGTTGAIVLRQPFGGFARSAVGPGLKAGGPNYVASLMRLAEVEDALPSAGEVEEPLVADLLAALAGQGVEAALVARLRRAATGYEAAMRHEYGREHDHFRLVGQDNFRRYLPVAPVHVRVHPDDTPFELHARVVAARIAGCAVVVTAPPGALEREIEVLDRLTDSWAAAIEFVAESAEQLAARIGAGRVERVRYASPQRVEGPVREAAAKVGLYLAGEPVLSVGRVELLHYLREQSLCVDYHRYGNLGARADEERAPVT
ncbi:MAG: aldehyde dehydrogenase family protein, partial [Thermoanaerobaculia bacterium]|nr:aldehyde dehydrogenase family protein [Thermoanaerobaculia bacterium]